MRAIYEESPHHFVAGKTMEMASFSIKKYHFDIQQDME